MASRSRPSRPARSAAPSRTTLLATAARSGAADLPWQEFVAALPRLVEGPAPVADAQPDRDPSRPPAPRGTRRPRVQRWRPRTARTILPRRNQHRVAPEEHSTGAVRTRAEPVEPIEPPRGDREFRIRLAGADRALLSG